MGTKKTSDLGIASILWNRIILLQKRSIFRNIVYNLFILLRLHRLPKSLTDSKTNIKSRIVEIIRKSNFKIIKILIFISKSII